MTSIAPWAEDDGRTPTDPALKSPAERRCRPRGRAQRPGWEMEERHRGTRHGRGKRAPGLPVILRRPPPALLSRPGSEFGTSSPGAPAESIRAVHGRPGVPCTPETPDPRLAPAQAPARTWTRSSAPPLALSGLEKGAEHIPAAAYLPSRAGRASGRAGGACGRAPIPHRGLLGAAAANTAPGGVGSPG